MKKTFFLIAPAVLSLLIGVGCSPSRFDRDDVQSTTESNNNWLSRAITSHSAAAAKNPMLPSLSELAKKCGFEIPEIKVPEIEFGDEGQPQPAQVSVVRPLPPAPPDSDVDVPTPPTPEQFACLQALIQQYVPAP